MQDFLTAICSEPMNTPERLVGLNPPLVGDGIAKRTVRLRALSGMID